MSKWACAFKVWKTIGDALDDEQEPTEVTLEFDVEFPADVVVSQAASVPWPVIR